MLFKNRTLVVIVLVLVLTLSYLRNTCFDLSATNAVVSVERIDWQESTKKSLMSDHDWSKIKKRKQSSDETHDKWIIVTSVAYPTAEVKKLAQIEGWKLVVVADSKTPKDWSCSKAVFLSVEKQQELGYKITDYLPFRSYSRKNIGYLFAIQHGAKLIYETDDDNYPHGGKIKFNQSHEGSFFVYQSDKAAINIYQHFGQLSIWPRGYPLEHIGDPPEHTFVKCSKIRALVQQGLVNGDPDVDAVFRLTRKDAGVTLNVTFDPKAPPVALPPGSYAPFNAQNTLFLYDGFWGMMMPPGPAFRVTDIWRAYYVIRLLQQIDGYLAFFGPNAFTERNAHSYLADMIDEKALYHDAGRMIAFLRQWKATKNGFFDQIMELTIALVDEKFLEPIDAVVMKAWLSDLISIGYVAPPLKSHERPCSHVLEAAKEVPHQEQESSYLGLGTTLKNILK